MSSECSCASFNGSLKRKTCNYKSSVLEIQSEPQVRQLIESVYSFETPLRGYVVGVLRKM